MSGPLKGIRIIEIAGIGPAPFASMMMADHGAEVIRIDRPDTPFNPNDILARSRTRITLDLKSPGDVSRLRRLCQTADGLIEGFRPGVMERLGLGPETLLADNARLVYGRMTGWGQNGPAARKAGHDINYIALSGALHSIGRKGQPPTPPLNLLGDFGGGAMMLAFGMTAALLAVRNGAAGQVVDAAITDGTILLMSMIWGFHAEGIWNDKTGENWLDSAAPFYDAYETSDGLYVAIGAIEAPFRKALRKGLGIDGDPLFDDVDNQDNWPRQKEALTHIFKRKSRDEWCEVFKDVDACFAPVLSLTDTPQHPHNLARNTFYPTDTGPHPAPAPRYSATPCDPPQAAIRAISPDDALIDQLCAARSIAQSTFE